MLKVGQPGLVPSFGFSKYFVFLINKSVPVILFSLIMVCNISKMSKDSLYIDKVLVNGGWDLLNASHQ